MITETIKRAIEDMQLALSGRAIAKQCDIYADILSYYSPHEKVLQAIDQLIRSETKFPPPHAVIKAVEGMGAKRHKEYDAIEDSDYPMQYLWDAYKILSQSGRQAAEAYMKSVRMPLNDRQRVFDKHRYRKDPEYKKWVNEQVKVIKQKMRGYGNPLQEVPF